MKAHVTVDCTDAAEAQRLRAALSPDDSDGVTCRTDGANLIIEASSDSIMGLVRGLDDVLGCLRAAGID